MHQGGSNVAQQNGTKGNRALASVDRHAQEVRNPCSADLAQDRRITGDTDFL
jgi:hypothetical protein